LPLLLGVSVLLLAALALMRFALPDRAATEAA
jgi:hypothetical protein